MRKVRKTFWLLAAGTGKPWVVTNPFGAKFFATWSEAMHYANSPTAVLGEGEY